MTIQKSSTSERECGASYGARERFRRHYASLILGLLICGWGIWSSAREGLSTVFTSYASTTNQLEAADRAVRLSPSSSDAQYLRASLLSAKELRADAVRAYEQAAALRPRDYVLWLELGRARDQANDLEGALAAFRESVRLAPAYAQPRWQLGNTLLRSGRRDEALAELRRAVASNPKLLAPAINLAWIVLNRDPQAVAQALQPETPSAHLALATFLARQGKAAESINHFRAAGDLPIEQRRALLNELLASENFAEAYGVWSHGRQTNGTRQGLASLANGGFEEPIRLDDPGFGWQLTSGTQAVRVSQDVNQPRTGAESMRLSWTGDSNPSTPVVSQIVLVEPNAHYRLRFAVRTEDLLTIGLPKVTAADARGDQTTILGESKPIPTGTNGWQDYAFDFKTNETARAVVIAIRRQPCPAAPCAALGRVWVDDFLLEKLEQATQP